MEQGQPVLLNGVMEHLPVAGQECLVVLVVGGTRHAKWIAAIAKGEFSFGRATISYDDNGRAFWKAKALRTAQDLPVLHVGSSFWAFS